MTPLQRDILLSQKQRAFSKAVVLVAPEKRQLVVLTAAVSRRSAASASDQCSSCFFLRKRTRTKRRKPTRTQRIPPNAFWPGGNKKKARSNTNNQASSTYLESLERCELQITSPRVSGPPVLRIKKRHQIEATTASRGASVLVIRSFSAERIKLFLVAP